MTVPLTSVADPDPFRPTSFPRTRIHSRVVSDLDPTLMGTTKLTGWENLTTGNPYQIVSPDRGKNEKSDPDPYQNGLAFNRLYKQLHGHSPSHCTAVLPSIAT